MRCDDVARELAVPTGDISPAALARHVAACPACADERAAAERFDQVWAATSPPHPPAGVFDRIWASVVRNDAPVLLSLGARRPRRSWLVPVLGTVVVAQAAALLLAFNLALRSDPPTADHALRLVSDPPPADAVDVRFDIEPGQTIMIELSPQGERTVCTPHLISQAELMEFDDGTDPWFDAVNFDLVIFNTFEGMPQ